MPGARQITTLTPSPERMIERQLGSVSADYAQDEIVYTPGFLRQYGARVALSWSGTLFGVALIAYTLIAFSLEDFFMHFLHPGGWFFVVFMVCTFTLPFRWMWTYRVQRAIIEGDLDANAQGEVARALS